MTSQNTDLSSWDTLHILLIFIPLNSSETSNILQAAVL
jgi:hypothetical protein